MFYVGRFAQAIARNAVQSLAPIVAFVVAFEGDPLRNAAIAVSALIIVIAVVSFLRFWFFHYRIAGESILIRDGILNKKQLDIGFDRIQAVNTRQNLLYRALGLTTVTFDSAGSSAEEGYLPAVSNEIADDLRARIRETPTRPDTASPDEPADTPPQPRQLMRLTAGDIVLAGLSSGRVFLLLAILGPLSELAQREIGDRIEETAVVEAISSIRPDAGLGMLLVLAIIAVVLALMLAVAVIGAFLRYHGFTLTTDGGVLRSTGGLLTRHEHSVSRVKVQSVTVRQNAVLRLFGRFGLRIKQASSGRTGSSRDFLVPISRAGHVRLVGEEIFGDEGRDLALDPHADRFERISPHYVRSRVVLFGVLPCCGFALILWPSTGAAALLAFLWLPVCLLVVGQVYRRMGFSAVPDGIALRSGFIGSHVVVWLHRKVQRVSITQSPFQRRLDLATMRLHLAAGSVRIPFIDHATARRLRDYVLYRVESSRLAWH